MPINEAMALLRWYNEWRRGADVVMPEPRAVGDAIDTVLSECERLRAAIAKREAGTVQDGYVMAPKEPTMAMLDAGYDSQGTADHEDLRYAWRAMLAASQQAAKEEGK